MAKETNPAPAPALVKDDETGLMKVESTGLVPCEMLVSEAGDGLRKGEIRGLSPDTAARMVKLGSAKLAYVTK